MGEGKHLGKEIAGSFNSFGNQSVTYNTNKNR